MYADVGQAWQPAKVTTWVMTPLLITETIERLEGQIKAYQTETFNDDNPQARINATKIARKNVIRLEREIINWQIVLNTYRGQSASVNASTMFTQEALQYNNMVKSFANWATNLGSSPQGAIGGTVVDIIKNSVTQKGRLKQRQKKNAVFTGSALDIDAFMNTLLLTSSLFQGFKDGNVKLFAKFNIGMLFAFADMNKTCSAALPQLKSGLVNTVCQDFDREEWHNFDMFINSGAACGMPDTSNPDAKDNIGYFEGLGKAVGIIATSRQALLGLSRIQEEKREVEAHAEERIFKDEIESEVDSFDAGRLETEGDESNNGDNSFNFENDASSESSISSQNDLSSESSFSSENEQVAPNESHSSVDMPEEPLVEEQFSVYNEDQRRGFFDSVMESDSNMLEDNNEAPFGDAEYGGMDELNLNQDEDSWTEDSFFAKFKSRYRSDSVQSFRRILIESKPKNANEMYKLWEQMKLREEPTQYYERRNTRGRRSLSTDASLKDGVWKSVCQQKSFKSDYQGMGFLEDRKGGLVSLMSFLTDSSQTITFSAGGGIEIDYTSTISDEMEFHSESRLMSENSKKEGHDRISNELFYSSEREDMHTRLGALKIKMGKGQKQEHKATRTVKITLDDDNDGL